jgi:predicted metal-dependent phosphoesterase TrpH
VAALASRLAEERRAYGFALARWQQERDAAEAALAAVRGAPGVSNPTWAAAQTAVSRVRQAAVGLGDARQAVERLTAGLALEAAAGADVSAILVGSGRLLREIDAARADADRQADGFAARLAR